MLRETLSLVLFVLLAAACSEPRCPDGYLQYGDTCRRCPLGQVRENRQCVPEFDEDGTEQESDGQGQTTEASIGDASGSQEQRTPQFDAGAADASSSPGQGISTVDADSCNDDAGGDGTECVEACTGASCDASAQCTVASECADPGPCKERVCGADGICGSRNQADHTPCMTLTLGGVCSAGSCIDCIDNSDCQNRGPLTACNTESRQCVVPTRCGDGVPQFEAGEECDDGNRINEDGCTNGCKRAVCGDGIVRNAGVSVMLEQCDPAAPGWSTRTCSSDCRYSVYTPSRSGACPAGTTAPLWGVCTVSCNADTDCPVVPHVDTPFCFPSVKVCAIICTEDSQCPNGLRCAETSGTMVCNGII